MPKLAVPLPLVAFVDQTPVTSVVRLGPHTKVRPNVPFANTTFLPNMVTAAYTPRHNRLGRLYIVGRRLRRLARLRTLDKAAAVGAVSP